MLENNTTKYRITALEKVTDKIKTRIEHVIQSFNKDKKLWLKLNEEKFVTRREFESFEETQKNLVKKVDSIRTNELPHINQALASLKTRVTVSTAINVGAIIVGIIAFKILK